ncbi:hypothetical protein SAMN05421752_105224 [Natronorubrum thiooxidans]|uniref:Uncharacterized protein n=1 Tax=Natronorubrum thiooxidans TaxID=308853 RepID=A0A1N7F0N0_9EURY|nr:hypothetical protein SAMN05421752_105224 [Natronorubrum thiooxidans]
MLVEVSNTGDETVDVPGDVTVEVDGERYRHLMNTGVGNEYDQLSSLEPGERIVRTLAFDIPDVDAPDRLTTTWEARDLTGALLSSTAEWELAPEAVTQPGKRIDGLAVGDVLEVRDQRTRYELTVTAIETDRGDDGRTAVTLDVENLGPSTIEDPIHHRLALVAADEPVERLDGDDPFEPVPLERGERSRVELAFEGDSAESRHFELQLTPYATAVWESTA